MVHTGVKFGTVEEAEEQARVSNDDHLSGSEILPISPQDHGYTITDRMADGAGFGGATWSTVDDVLARHAKKSNQTPTPENSLRKVNAVIQI
jgi:hypothetical protein